MSGGKEQSVHVGQLDGVVVEQDDFPHATPREHFGRDAAHAADADLRGYEPGKRKERRRVREGKGEGRKREKGII